MCIRSFGHDFGSKGGNKLLCGCFSLIFVIAGVDRKNQIDVKIYENDLENKKPIRQ